MAEESIFWVRSVLGIYRQAATDAAREGVDAAMRQRVIDDLSRVHSLFTAYENREELWQQGFKGSEAGVREVFLPLAEGALLCAPDSPIRALIEFAAEEIASLFEGE